MQKVRAGDPLRIPPGTFNTFIDAARDYQARRLYQGQGSQAAARHSGLVLVKNASGADRDRLDILGVDGPGLRRRRLSRTYMQRMRRWQF